MTSVRKKDARAFTVLYCHKQRFDQQNSARPVSLCHSTVSSSKYCFKSLGLHFWIWSSIKSQTRLATMDKTLDLHHESNHFFDDVFSQMERQIARMHHDMRNAMFRLAPMDLVSAGNQELESRLCQLRNVFSQSEDGSRQLSVTLDMSSFKPEEIEVKVKDNLLTVNARHEEKDEHSYVKNEFHRQFTLPAGTDVEQIKSSLSKDGVLAIKGPVAAIEEAKTIPITQGDS